MSYIKFFETHNIDEVAEKTHISPVILNFLQNRRFDKIEKHKFYGFIKIIEREYGVNLDDLKDEFKEYIDSLPPEEDETIAPQPIKENNKGGYLLVFILMILIIGVVYYMKKDGKLSQQVAKKESEKNTTTFVIEKKEINFSKEKNISDIKQPEEKVTKKRVFKVIPQERLWFKVRYLDDNSSKEYLTSNVVDLNESRNQYIKFGHGLFTIDFNDENLSPNTKKIVRYILIDGNLSKTKKVESYEWD